MGQTATAPLRQKRSGRGAASGRHKSVDMFKVYILKSLVGNKYYIGHTENLGNRLERHNKGLVKSTKSKRPLEIVYTENYQNKNDAYRRELQIKSYKGGKAFKKLINS